MTRPIVYLSSLLMAVLVTGCNWAPGNHGHHGHHVWKQKLGIGHLIHGRPTVWIENPLLIPVDDREFIWLQLVDTLDDYFTIEREQRIQQIGNVLTEGRIDTFPEIGATALEPWRRDSTHGAERLFSTLQSIRRRAVVRTWPAEGGYRVEVQVFQELEDLERPEFAPVGGRVFRHDGTLVRNENRPENDPITLGWIPLGRDLSLEQQILAEIQARLSGPF